MEERNTSKKMFSLKEQIARILMSVIIIVVLLLTTLLLVMISSYQKGQTKKHLEELTVYAETLDNSMGQLNDVIGNIYSANDVFKGINKNQSVIEQLNNINTLLNLLQIQVRSNHSLSGLFIYYSQYENVLYYVKEKMSFSDKELLKKYGKFFLNTYNGNYSTSVISTEGAVYYNVFLKKELAAIGGNIRLNLGLPDQEEKSGTYGVIYNNTFYRVAGENMELSAEDCATLESGRNGTKGRVIYLHELDSVNMSVVEIVPQSPWLYINWVHIILAILSFSLYFLLRKLYRFVSDQLSKPLEDMTVVLQQIQTGVWEVNFTAPNRVAEIENVRETVRIMLKEIEQWKIRNYEDKIEKQQTKLQYLQLQLAPHFYTNCLKNAYYMLMLKEYENTEQFLLCLSTHIRYLLQKDVMLVSVKAERDFTINYVNLQKQMTSKSILCEMVIDEDVLEQEIPILSLQAFVENSIKYARDIDVNDLVIKMTVRYRRTDDGNYIDITIKDNGQGYSEEVLAMLNLREPSEEQKLGVGITNLQSRIRIHYGKEATWYFENTTGAFSEIIIPAK